MKKTEYIEITVKLYKHQVDFLKESAKRKGKAITKRTGKSAYVKISRILRENLDQYIFVFKPNIKKFLKLKKQVTE